jgi:hypothetical protein
MGRFTVILHLPHLCISVSQVVFPYSEVVDLKVSPKGEGFNPMFGTIKAIRKRGKIT